MGAVLLSCALCRVHGGETSEEPARENDGPQPNDTTWTRAVIGGLVLVAAVLLLVVGVLVMAAKEEDGRAMTKILTHDASRMNEAGLASSSADSDDGQNEASEGSLAGVVMPKVVA